VEYLPRPAHLLAGPLTSAQWPPARCLSASKRGRDLAHLEPPAPWTKGGGDLRESKSVAWIEQQASRQTAASTGSSSAPRIGHAVRPPVARSRAPCRGPARAIAFVAAPARRGRSLRRRGSRQRGDRWTSARPWMRSSRSTSAGPPVGRNGTESCTAVADAGLLRHYGPHLVLHGRVLRVSTARAGSTTKAKRDGLHCSSRCV
jgi:hypothetical protein